VAFLFVACLLVAQNGWCATSGIQLLGNHVILMVFDCGGSISTHSLDIHQFLGEFLQILLGLTFADRITLSFNYTISPTENNQKKIQVVMLGKKYSIIVNMLLFLSDLLHSWGMTVWSGRVTIDEEEKKVIVTYSWVDLL
jgi:hypothetical protein